MSADRRRTRRAARAAAPAALLAAAAVLRLAAAPAPPPASAAARSDQTSRRIQTVVIDPGHGGTESGAKGRFGNLEKDITLAIALKLKALIERGMGSEVVLTRDRDVDVSLENRSAIANNHKAGLFISLHANGAVQKRAAGSETFFLSLNATDEETRRLAYLENNGSDLQSHIDPSSDDDLMMILWDMAQNAYVKESSRLAEYVQGELDAMLGLRNRGIKQAPFKILRGVACPAILVEAAFLSNPDEEQKLASEDYQAKIAEAVYRGLTRFLRLPE